MWIVRLTPSDEAARFGAQQSIQTIQSDDVEDFLKHPSGDWSWNTIDKMLREGTLKLVEIDYIPTTLGGQLARV
jgi:hypothetical protein